MRYIFLLCSSLVVFATFAQAPNGINYQAAVRDAQGNPLSNQLVSLKLSILTGSAFGAIVYAENHNNIVTNQQGLVNLIIGQGSVIQGNFSSIDWANGSKYLKVELNNVTLGTTQFLSVPYALYAEKTNIQAGNGIAVNGNVISNTGDNDNNPTNEIQNLSINGSILSLTPNGGQVTLPSSSIALQQGSGISVSQNGNIYTISNTGDLNNNNEIQNLEINGNVLKITGGNEVTLPTAGGGGNPVAPGFSTSQIINMANPVAGMIVLNTDDKALYYYSGMNWYKLNGTLISQPGSYVVDGPNDCLVAYYTFDDGTASDVKGSYEANNNGCTFTNEVNSYIGSGKSAKFESNDFLSVSGQNPLYNLTHGTVTFWIKSTAADNTILFANSDVSSSVFRIRFLINSGETNLYYNSSNNFGLDLNTNNPSPLNGSWHHVAVTLKPYEHKLYIDGQLMETQTNYSYAMIDNSYNNGMLIGKYGGSSNFNFVGFLDNIRIYCKALTAAEVFQIFNAGQ